MTGLAARSRARRPGRSAAALAVVGVLLAGTLAHTGSASASPTDAASARAQAAQIASQVEDLRTRVAVAAERYNDVQSRLSTTVTESIKASERLNTLQGMSSQGRAEATRRVSAIYRAGGGLSLYATVLDGQTPGDVMSRLRAVQSIVEDDLTRGDDLQDAVHDAAATQARLAELEARRGELAGAADDARDEVARLLSQQEAALSDANATVTRLVAEEQERRETAAEAAAATTLQDVGALLGDDAPGNPYAAAAIAAAQSKLGLPYLWGGTGPDAYDCSGLLQWAYRQAGLSILRVAADQYRSGPEVELSAIAPGDLVFWSKNPANKPGIHHVAMYVGKGMMIEAPYTGAFIRVVPLRLGPQFAGVVRPGLSA